MAERILLWDTVNGGRLVSTSTIAGMLGSIFKDHLFVGDDATSIFETFKGFTTTTKVDVLWNGRLVEESSDFQRDEANDEIETLNDAGVVSSLENLARMRVRVYNESYSHDDQFFTGDGATSEYTITKTFTASSLIDVWFNGRLVREDNDWERDVAINKVKIIDGAPATPLNLLNNVRLRVRVHDSATFSEVFFTGGVASVSVNCLFSEGDKIDLYLNGRLKEEGKDWSRTVSTSLITIVDGATITTSNTQIRVRIW